MRATRAELVRWARTLGGLLAFVGIAAGVVVLLLWLAGKFEEKVPSEVPPRDVAAVSPRRTAPVRVIRRPMAETAVGTIRAVHETSLGSKLLARVVEVNLKAGQSVRKGEALVRLDDADLQAKLQQAKAASVAAEAAHRQAQADEKRAVELAAAAVMSQQERENVATALRTAEAGLLRAREVVNEVQATLDWATVRSPLDGVVIDKKIDVGDLVTPGQLLVTLFDPDRMQLVANVRESLAQRLAVGQTIEVRVDGLDKRCSGTVSEIVPQAQSASRAFQVKVTGPCPTGVYTGMFGRVFIPLDDEELLVIPRAAVRHVGQLELVDVVEDGRLARRAIRTGRSFDDGDVEALSGLRADELVALSGEEGSRD